MSSMTLGNRFVLVNTLRHNLTRFVEPLATRYNTIKHGGTRRFRLTFRTKYEDELTTRRNRAVSTGTCRRARSTSMNYKSGEQVGSSVLAVNATSGSDKPTSSGHIHEHKHTTDKTNRTDSTRASRVLPTWRRPHTYCQRGCFILLRRNKYTQSTDLTRR